MARNLSVHLCLLWIGILLLGACRSAGATAVVQAPPAPTRTTTAGPTATATQPAPTPTATRTAVATKTPAPTLSPVPTATPSPTPRRLVHLAAVGDVMLGRSLGYNIVNVGPEYPFAAVTEVLRAADLTLGNLESALGDTGLPAPKAYPFRAPPAAAEALAMAGFDIMSLANNHGMDYGPEALLQAINLLEAQGIVPLGAGVDAHAARAPYIVDVNGLRLAFLAYVNVPVETRTGFDTRSWEATDSAPGLAWGEPESVARDVAAVAPEVDHVIVILHSAHEYQARPSEPQVAISHAAVDAGAALVIGHHAHILQGVERYNGGVIVYGLGNFAFEIDGDPSSAILNVWLDAEGVRELNFIPAIVQYGGAPRLANEIEAAEILSRIDTLSEALQP